MLWQEAAWCDKQQTADLSGEVQAQTETALQTPTHLQEQVLHHVTWTLHPTQTSQTRGSLHWTATSAEPHLVWVTDWFLNPCWCLNLIALTRVNTATLLREVKGHYRVCQVHHLSWIDWPSWYGAKGNHGKLFFFACSLSFFICEVSGLHYSVVSAQVVSTAAYYSPWFSLWCFGISWVSSA